MKIVITGGSGFTGTALSRYLLDKGHTVIALGRSTRHTYSGEENFHWVRADTTVPGGWQSDIAEADIVVNLAGKNIFGYWTKAFKKALYDSRILTTRNVVAALSDDRDQVLLSTSAVGYYGDRGEEVLTETSSPGNDFLARLSVDWEAAALEAEKKRTRVALMRFGIVLGKGGGVISKMEPAFKKFLGGPLGSGNQWFPWIHLKDLLACIDKLMSDESISGPVNFTSPGPVRQKDLSKAVGSALNRPSFMPAPAFAMRLLLGEFAQILLMSQKVVPEVLMSTGFKFNFQDIETAVEDIIQ